MWLRFEPFGDRNRWFGVTRSRGVPMDAYRRGDAFYVHFDMPGIDPDAIELTVDNDVLTVRAERVWKEKDGDEIVVNERAQGTFERDVYLSDRLDREHLEATYRDGVLTVRLPLLAESKPHKIPIAVAKTEKAKKAPASSASAAAA